MEDNKTNINIDDLIDVQAFKGVSVGSGYIISDNGTDGVQLANSPQEYIERISELEEQVSQLKREKIKQALTIIATQCPEPKDLLSVIADQATSEPDARVNFRVAIPKDLFDALKTLQKEADSTYRGALKKLVANLSVRLIGLFAACVAAEKVSDRDIESLKDGILSDTIVPAVVQECEKYAAMWGEELKLKSKKQGGKAGPPISYGNSTKKYLQDLCNEIVEATERERRELQAKMIADPFIPKEK